jgi:2'-5' RNA ligase
MKLKQNYDKLFAEFKKAANSISFQVDEFIDSNSDDRYGITLIIRPPISVRNRIQIFLDELKKLEPNQYYYENSDIHITVLSIISCYSGFKLDQININDYTRLISECLAKSKKFDINFNGVTATLNGIITQGFISDNTLNDLRDNLRLTFKNSGLEQSIDQRYKLQTAHSTVVRFRNEVKKQSEFMAVIDKYRDFDFGTFNVDHIELVFNDWYQRIENVKSLGVFMLDDN